MTIAKIKSIFIISLLALIPFLTRSQISMMNDPLQQDSELLTPASINMKSEIIKIILTETHEVMNALKITRRINTSLDGPLDFYVYNFRPGLEGTFQDYIPENKLSGIERYYPKSRIVISKRVNSALSNPNSVSQEELVFCKSIVAHELTHFLQIGRDEQLLPASVIGYKNYVLQPKEFEGHTVNAYYYLMKMSPDTLSIIMKKDISTAEKWRLLINAFRSFVFPNQLPIFD
jgi:hypothetical protein